MLAFAVKSFLRKGTAKANDRRHVGTLLKPVKLDLTPTEPEAEGERSDVFSIRRANPRKLKRPNGDAPPPREPVASPFHGGVCVESYQLVPLLKALRIPRVNLHIADAVVLLSIEEIGVNALRETFHRWVRTLALPVRDGEIGAPLPYVPARIRRDAPEVDDPDERERAGETTEEVSAGLRVWLRTYEDELTERLAAQLRFDGEVARGREDERYRQRQGDVSALIEQSTLARLTREIELLRERGRQLFDETEHLAEIEQSIEDKQKELMRRRQHYEELRDQLQRERTRILDHLLPKRFAMAGDAQAFPVALEIRLPVQRA